MALSSQRLSVFDPIQDVEFDHLGRYQFARRLLKRVSAPNCSSAVGLYGGWGTGKTSILNLIKKINDQDNIPDKPLMEIFDVWPYEVSGDLSLPILFQMQQWESALELSTHSMYWRRVFGVLAQAGMDIALQKFLNIRTSDLQTYADNLQELKSYVDDIRKAQDAFCELAQLVSQAHQNRRIVFLIDNLDRCSPENVVRLLESIKNFLHAPNCVWVFAMDSGVIASYIDHKYEGTRMDGNSYLDKIVPEQYHIPPISDHDISRLHRFLAMVQPSNAHGLPTVDLGKIPQIPEVLVPRRLLKTAHKFYEAYTSDLPMGSAATPDMAFALILLYNTWPVFYEHFASGKVDHVRGILENFVDNGEIPGIPLSKKFTEDQALKHYLNACFIQGQIQDTVNATLSSCMVWLRQVGLP